jgi:hypothetical protein
VKKTFREYDKDKTGVIKDDLKKLLRRLCNDECIIGKIPKVSDDEVLCLYRGIVSNLIIYIG